MSDKNSSSEPSMEQILESIAEIIADDGSEFDQVTSLSHEAIPVMHNPVSDEAETSYLEYAAAPAFLQSSPVVSSQPIAEPVSTGSLTDRLANMDQNTITQATEELPMRPVPENNGVTPPGFMGSGQVVEPVPVNMPVPHMMGQQPSMGTQGFPVESAEDFLANNAQRVSVPVESVPAALNAAPQGLVQVPVQHAPEFALNPALAPSIEPQLAAVVEPTPVVPQVIETMPEQQMIQPSVMPEISVRQSEAMMPAMQTMLAAEVAPIVPVTPSPTDDVLNSFRQVEEQATVSPIASVESELVAPQFESAPADVSLLDASYISATAQTPLTAEPVNVQTETVMATTPPIEAVLSAAVTAETQAMMAVPNIVPEAVIAEPAVTEDSTETTDKVTEEAGGVDLNSGIHAMVQPMVQKWLDENLSKVVEEVVRHELASALTKK